MFYKKNEYAKTNRLNPFARLPTFRKILYFFRHSLTRHNLSSSILNAN